MHFVRRCPDLNFAHDILHLNGFFYENIRSNHYSLFIGGFFNVVIHCFDMFAAALFILEETPSKDLRASL